MRLSLLSFLWLAVFAASASAQTRQDIPVGQVPENVRQVLAKYMQVLQIEDEEESASQASAIMGGSLMGRDNTTMSSSTRQYGFKKDRQNVRFYSVPPVITRCQRFENQTEGFQTTAVTGTRYKI